MFDSTRYTRECLNTSLHTTTMAEKGAIGQYYQDIMMDATCREMAYGTAMIDKEEGDEWQDEEGTEEGMTREYVEETIRESG
jgi:Ran GTPase-activating protein (RanGAP) involved in mRNA processing and transport